MLIKTMPVNMAQKKEIKSKLLSADTFRLQGLKQFKWRRRKLWEYLKVRRKELVQKVELWRQCFISIERIFGTGVVSLFLFIKWLLFLNLTISIIIVCFVTVPSLFLNVEESEPCSISNSTDRCCTNIYVKNWSNLTLTPYNIVLGNGWIESTVLFYGFYPNSVLKDIIFHYNLPLAYIAAVIVYFLFSLCAIVQKSAQGLKERLVESEGQHYKYCSTIFSGWDFCISNEVSAKIKNAALYSEIKENLNYERRKEERKNMTRDENLRLMCTRIFLNGLCLIICVVSGSFVFFTFHYSFNELQKEINNEHHKLFLEFFPYLCIVGLNLIIPNILAYFVSLEKYSPMFSLRIALFKTIIFRLSLLVVLLSSFYSLVICTSDTQSSCTSSLCHKPLCWETYIGQQIYKLLILDVFSNIVITFIINFPRMLVAKHLKCKLARVLGSQEFELPKHVLDVIYYQTLVWLGSFYVPLLPALASILFFLVFYVKKFACLVNSSPSTTVYRASRSDSMFMSLLLLSFIVAVIPWAFTLTELVPSKSCGPFMGRVSAWSIVVDLYDSFPLGITYCIEKFASCSILIPIFFILTCYIYYYYVIANANKQMVAVLKKQLILEGHDKQFLLNRLSAFIKQHQERHKAVRSIDPQTTNS